MLTGARPFGGATAYALMDEILSKEPPPPSQVNLGIPPALDDIVLPERGEASRDALLALGCPLEWHSYPMGHSVSMEEIADLNAWLLKVLASAA